MEIRRRLKDRASSVPVMGDVYGDWEGALIRHWSPDTPVPVGALFETELIMFFFSFSSRI